MLLKMFSVYDAKVSSYLQPFFLPATGHALRAFESTVNDPKSNLYRYPADYTLMEIGTFNESTGTVEMLDVKINLGCALEYKKVEQRPDLSVTPIPTVKEICEVSGSELKAGG